MEKRKSEQIPFAASSYSFHPASRSISGNSSVENLESVGRSVKSVWLMEGELTNGKEIQRVFIDIDASPFLVGRKSNNHLSISNQTVSGLHAELFAENDKLFLKDHGSTNGTFLNGKRVTSAEEVRDGDLVHFGKARFYLRKNQDSIPAVTMAFDAAGDAMAHLLFEGLWDGKSLKPHFQPILRFSDRHILGFEALARCDLPGLEDPGSMFKIAGQHGAETELSVLLRKISVKTAQPVLHEYDLYLNTHPTEMESKELFTSIEQLRQEFEEASLVLEVHEDGISSINFLRELKHILGELDIRLAYDDFGRGQSRLKALGEVTPDIVKFDIELIRGLHKNATQRISLIETILRFVKSLGVVSLAEGIEQVEEASVCEQLGFDLAQGYHFGRPAPIHQWSPGT